MLVDDEFDAEECCRAMQAYCCEVVLVPKPFVRQGLAKRLLQLKSLASLRSFERLQVAVPSMQRALDRVLRARRFRRRQPGVFVPWRLQSTPRSTRREAPAPDGGLAQHRLRPGQAIRLRRQQPGPSPLCQSEPAREELGTYRDADGVYLCSALDERRLLDEVPGARTTVIPNAADVEYYQPRSTDPPPDGRTVVYFGLLSYVPNVDGVIHFIRDIWPRIAEAHSLRPARECSAHECLDSSDHG